MTNENELPDKLPRLYLVLGAIIGFLLALLLIEKDACAGCVTHTVTKGQTLGKISEQYFGSRKFWKDIKHQNDLKRNWVKTGQKLHFYVPGKKDWREACESIISQRVPDRYRDRLKNVIPEIPQAIQYGFFSNEVPLKKLEMCRWALATAEHESMYEFAVGSAGEVGMYQFKLDTIRLTGRWYDIPELADGTDSELVRMLLNGGEATHIFLLHFAELYKRKGSLWLAWRRYNNGSEAAAYASKIMKRYQEIRMLKPMECKP